MVKFYSQSKTRKLIDSLDLAGSTPPGVFVGRYGYPKVDIGPLVPPEMGDTSIMDTPEHWMGKSIQEIVDFRFKLVRGKYSVSVKDFQNGGKIVDLTRELGLSVNSTNGLLSGTPQSAGSYVVTISASNIGGTGLATLALGIGTPVYPPAIVQSPSEQNRTFLPASLSARQRALYRGKMTPR